MYYIRTLGLVSVAWVWSAWTQC